MTTLNPFAISAFEKLCAEAKKNGFEPKIESGYRSFERQLLIWNEKAEGKRKLLAQNGEQINIKNLSDLDLMNSILLWSALPGTSRHEWGTDIDVIDANAIPKDYEVQLTIEESYSTFGKFHKWLDFNMEKFGFRRVFLPDIGKVQPEPWHLSYFPESKKIEENFNAAHLAERLKNSKILLLPQILDNLDQILENYVKCYFY